MLPENPKVFELYPLSAKLGLRFVRPDPRLVDDHEGFDGEEVDKALGSERYAALINQVAQHSSVFVCAHRHYTEGPSAGYEVQCLYAKDVERFLEGVPLA